MRWYAAYKEWDEVVALLKLPVEDFQVDSSDHHFYDMNLDACYQLSSEILQKDPYHNEKRNFKRLVAVEVETNVQIYIHFNISPHPILITHLSIKVNADNTEIYVFP